MTVHLDQASDRHHMRIDLSAQATIDGHGCDLNDLSISGVGLANLPADLTVADTTTISLVLPCQGFDIKLAFRVATVWRNPERGRAGFRFLDLTRTQTDTLRSIVESALAGNLVAVDGVLHPAGAPAQRKAPAPTPATMTSTATFKRRLNFAGTVAAGVLLTVVAGTLVYDRVTILETKLAAISAPMLDIKAPSDGALDGAVLKVGQPLSKGDIVFEMIDNVLKGDTEIAAAELERDRTRLELLAKQTGLTTSANREANVNAQSALKLAKSRNERAQTDLQLAEARFARSQAMATSGVIAKDALEADQKLAMEARYEAAQATRDLEDARSRLRLISEGFDASLARLENMTQPRLADSVAMARADVGVREARVRALTLRREDLIVRSPCDCIVEAFYSTTGEHAKKGDLVAQLRARETQDLNVEALVNQDDADRIAIGSSSEIVLPLGGKRITGKVVEINRVPRHAKRSGLPDRPLDLHQYAAVTIAPEHALVGVEPGMPVEVRLRSNTMKRLAQSLASVFHRQENAALADEPILAH